MDTPTTLRSKIRLLACGIFLATAIIDFAQPAITTQPEDQTNYVGTTATLTVSAIGTESGGFSPSVAYRFGESPRESSLKPILRTLSWFHNRTASCR